MAIDIRSYKSMHTLMVDPFMFILHCCNKVSGSKSINEIPFMYDFQVYPASKTYLYNSYASHQRLSDLNSDTVDLLPMAVRYADIENQIYIIERPPFQTNIDFYPNKRLNARLANHIPNKKIWIPWTVFVVSLGKSVNHLKAAVYFNDKPLDSLYDLVIKGYTPNLFGDSKICFGNSLFTFGQRLEQGDIEYNISTVYNYLFNDYFTQWNPDISPNYVKPLHDYFSNNHLIDRVLEMKKYPKGIQDISSWNYGSASKSWVYVLFLLSTLNYEETMDLVAYFKKHQIAPGHVKYLTASDTLEAMYLDDNKNFAFQSQQYDSSYSINNSYSYYLHAFKNAISPYSRYKKLELSINVSFVDFPEDTDKSIINSEDVYAYIYSIIFDRINHSVSALGDSFSLEEIFFHSSQQEYDQFVISLTNQFMWGSNHIKINYIDYMNFINQPLEGLHV
jgi:hypothetical protein